MRALLTAATTIVVALVVALAVPVAQLRMITVQTSCCCPDQSKCHCPHEKTEHGKVPSIRACHRSQNEIVSADLPAFTPPTLASLDVIAPLGAAPNAPLFAPHATPDATPPYGPS